MVDPKTPAFKITRVKLANITPDDRKLKTYNDAEIARHMAHYRHFGNIEPLRIWQGKLIDGDAWYAAAERMQLTTVPVIDLSHFSEVDAIGYSLAIKKLAESGEWDWANVVDLWEELAATDFPDLDLTGFDSGERDDIRNELIDDQQNTEDNATPPVEAQAVSQPGDVWTLGKHRLMCGDSTDQCAVDKLMGSQNADFLFTSPPYLNQRDYSPGQAGKDWEQLMQGVFQSAKMKQGAQILVNLGLVHRDNEWLPYWQGWISFMQSSGWKRFGLYVWDQGGGMMGNWSGRLAPSFELIFHFCRKPLTARKTKKKQPGNIKLSKSTQRRPDGTLKDPTTPSAGLNTHKIPDSVIRVGRHKGGLNVEGDESSHPALFPVALPVEIMSPWTKAGDICYEPFCGSGTQIIAAEKIERRCFAMELEAVFADLSIRRWQQYTEQKATLDGDGRTFAEVQKDRLNS